MEHTHTHFCCVCVRKRKQVASVIYATLVIPNLIANKSLRFILRRSKLKVSLPASLSLHVLYLDKVIHVAI